MLMVFSGYLIIEQRFLIIKKSYFTKKSLLKCFLSLYSKSKKNAKNFPDNLIVPAL